MSAGADTEMEGDAVEQGWPRYRDEAAAGFACLDLGDGRMVKTEVLYSDGRPFPGHHLHHNHNHNQYRQHVASYELFDSHPHPHAHAHAPPRYQHFDLDMSPFYHRSEPPSAFNYEPFANYSDRFAVWADEPQTPSASTYDPFARNFLRPDPPVRPEQPDVVQNSPPKPAKKRIVAEVKPMRPSYSDVLAKTPKVDAEPPKSRNSEKVRPEPARPAVAERRTRAPEKKDPGNGKRAPSPTESRRSSGSDSGEAAAPPKKTAESTATTKTKRRRPPARPVRDEAQADAPRPVRVEPEEDADESPLRDERIELEANDDDDEAEETKIREKTDPEKTKKKNRETRNAKSNHKADKNKKNSRPKTKKTKGNYYASLVTFYLEAWLATTIKSAFWLCSLVIDVCRMSLHLSFDLLSTFIAEASIRSRSFYSTCGIKATYAKRLSDIGNYIDMKFGHTRFGFWRKIKWFNRHVKQETESDSSKKTYTNIPLPSTGEEAMKRLLACKGKDPYSILGVGVQCSDDDIKRYYRRQAFLVHPDKNQQPGAEEAFKILQHAFDMIGEPERREAYEQRVLESRHAEAARSELADLVARLQEKVRRAASTIRCSGCSKRHPRTPTNRPCYAARYCSQCKIHHSAKEGDIWAESSCLGLFWLYYACMDGAVYQITQWASCQKKNLKHVKADTHHVQYRIVLGNKPQGNKNPNINASDLEDFLNNLYSKAKQHGNSPNGKTMPNSQQSDTTRNKKKNKKSK